MTCAHKWVRPRTCKAENATMATSMDNSDLNPTITYVADLAINPVTKEVDFSNSVPILPQMEVTPELRESMKQILVIILGFFEHDSQPKCLALKKGSPIITIGYPEQVYGSV